MVWNVGRSPQVDAAAAGCDIDERRGNYADRLMMRLRDVATCALMQRWTMTGINHPSGWLGDWQTALANEHSLYNTY